jgi:hypothetical protein
MMPSPSNQPTRAYVAETAFLEGWTSSSVREQFTPAAHAQARRIRPAATRGSKYFRDFSSTGSGHPLASGEGTTAENNRATPYPTIHRLLTNSPTMCCLTKKFNISAKLQ